MRLVVFGSGHPFRGGVARTTTEMVGALENRGHQALYLTPRRQYPNWLFPGASDRDPDACRLLACARPVLEPMNPMTWAASRRIAEIFAGDAWIVPYWTWAWAGLWRFLLGGTRPPAVAVVHNPVDHDAGIVQRRAARSVLGRCQALFTHAGSLERRLADAYPGVPTGFYLFPPTAVESLPDRTAARAALQLPADRRVALFLGLIRPYKGVDLLIDAVAELPPDSDWLVLVAGEPWGGLEKSLRRQVRDSGLEDRVRLALRWVPELEVPRLLVAADLVVLPYRSGSQSAVAPMALAAGVPVLTTDVGGVGEIVRHGIDGWVIEPGSVDALAAALVELDRPTLQRLGRGAVDGRGRLTWDGYADALEDLITSVVQRSNVPTF
jgi:glycosyltransferase involved in cell wall biosynthesis